VPFPFLPSLCSKSRTALACALPDPVKIAELLNQLVVAPYGIAKRAAKKLNLPRKERPLGLKPAPIFQCLTALKGRSSTVVSTFVSFSLASKSMP
jgi:hypothetical protein